MKMRIILFGSLLFFGIIILVVVESCKKKPESLKEVFQDDFYIGAAIIQNQIYERDLYAEALLLEQFNSITAEDAMKWENIHPKPSVYSFALTDSFVALGERNNMFIVGHTLLWHQQTPNWVFEDSLGNLLSRDSLLSRLHDHINTIVSRYKGRVNGWDVVNEAIDEGGQLRKTKWLEIIGEDYIQKAFEYAHEADPDAELYYNDYNIELPTKRHGTLIGVIQKLKSEGLRIDGIGIQAHWHLDVPDIRDIDSSILEFSGLGLKVMFTEFDIDVLPRPENYSGAEVSDGFEMRNELNPYAEGLPDSVQEKLAIRYADIFKVFLKYKANVSRVTFWGIYDGQSWKNNWPVKGRTNYPLLFDRNYQPKPAFYSIIKAAKQKN